MVNISVEKYEIDDRKHVIYVNNIVDIAESPGNNT